MIGRLHNCHNLTAWLAPNRWRLYSMEDSWSHSWEHIQLGISGSPGRSRWLLSLYVPFHVASHHFFLLYSSLLDNIAASIQEEKPVFYLPFFVSLLPMTFCPHKSYGHSQGLCRCVYQGPQISYFTCHLAFESTVAGKVVGLMALDGRRTVLGSKHGRLVVHPDSCSIGTKSPKFTTRAGGIHLLLCQHALRELTEQSTVTDKWGIR